MNRRDFVCLSTAGLVSGSRLLSAQPQSAPATTPLFVRGLAMAKFSDPDFLRVALPKAPHHVATIRTYPLGESRNQEPTTSRLVGNVEVEGVQAGGANPGIQLPEIIHMRELYPGSVGRFDESPTVISIPWTAIRGVHADVLSEDRWTFIWKDTREEVQTFRPRKVAESIRIDITSQTILRVGKTQRIRLGDVSEVHTDFVPEHADAGDFTEHFDYYMRYVDTQGDPRRVEPKKVGRTQQATRPPVFASAFTRMFPVFACFVILVD